MKISFVILTFNSEKAIGSTIESVQKVSDDIHVVDSYSTDGTVEIVKRYGVHVVQHSFHNYSSQRNWAIENLPLKYEWEMHLDADENLSPDLINALADLNEEACKGIQGFMLPRLMIFMGREIRHGGMYPIWHMRLFRRGIGKCENRLYDQHFFVDGNTGEINCPIIDNVTLSLSEWTIRHNKWSDLEVETLLSNSSSEITSDVYGNKIQRKRALKSMYYKCPKFFRCILLFLYRYVIRFGFLDGVSGLIFYMLQTLWFRFLVDAKLYESQRRTDV